MPLWFITDGHVEAETEKEMYSASFLLDVGASQCGEVASQCCGLADGCYGKKMWDVNEYGTATIEFIHICVCV